MKKYRIIKGVFEGREFIGNETVICGEIRIWDFDSIGRSYPIENCEVIEWVCLVACVDAVHQNTMKVKQLIYAKNVMMGL